MKKTLEKRQKALKKIDSAIDVANNTKASLIQTWEENESFLDKDYMKTKGVMTESVGLTGLLLLLLAFNEEPRVITQEDRDTITKIHASTIQQIYDWVSNDGYTPDPLISMDTNKAPDLFNKDFGYIDTITWVLSVTILSRRLENDQIIVVEDSVHDKYLELMASSLEKLLNAQRDDGIWGFRSDKSSSGAMYFTYSAGAAMADFFDYILGEIAYTYEDLSDSEKDAKCAELKDNAVLAYLNKELKDKLPQDTVENSVIDARARLQKWLLEECLLEMPKLARCEDISGAQNDEYRKRLGLWEHTPDGDAEKIYAPYMRYYNLNYIYYMLDLMVTASTDKRFEEICAGPEREAFMELCRSKLDEQDAEYYLGDPDDPSVVANLEELWSAMMEQTVHTTRAQYMIAARTGALFWDRAELQIMWAHEAKKVSLNIAEVYTKKTLKDPSIAPMALRANTLYSYYISEQPDMSVDRLFEDICKERADQSSSKTVIGLWDANRYNLLVTERSIESIVDYYDYLYKFEADALTEIEPSENVVTTVVASKSDFEKALDAKIAEYLQSEEGKKIIEKSAKSVAPKATAKATPATLDVASVTEFINHLNMQNRTKLDTDGDEWDALMEALESLMSKVVQCSIYRTIKSGISRNARDSELALEKLNSTSPEIYRQLQGLIVDMSNNENLTDGDNSLKYLYNKIKSLNN